MYGAHRAGNQDVKGVLSYLSNVVDACVRRLRRILVIPSVTPLFLLAYAQSSGMLGALDTQKITPPTYIALL